MFILECQKNGKTAKQNNSSLYPFHFIFVSVSISTHAIIFFFPCGKKRTMYIERQSNGKTMARCLRKQEWIAVHPLQNVRLSLVKWTRLFFTYCIRVARCSFLWETQDFLIRAQPQFSPNGRRCSWRLQCEIDHHRGRDRFLQKWEGLFSATGLLSILFFLSYQYPFRPFHGRNAQASVSFLSFHSFLIMILMRRSSLSMETLLTLIQRLPASIPISTRLHSHLSSLVHFLSECPISRMIDTAEVSFPALLEAVTTTRGSK